MRSSVPAAFAIGTPSEGVGASANDNTELELLRRTLSNERHHRREAERRLADLEGLTSRLAAWDLLRILRPGSPSSLQVGDSMERKVTTAFVDLRNFTGLSERMSTRGVLDLLNGLFGDLARIATKHSGFIDKYIGDAIMIVFPGYPDDAVRAAIAMFDALRHQNVLRVAAGSPPLALGAGMSTGLARIGVVGADDRMQVTAVGDSVNLASRLESMSKEYGAPVLLSESTLYGLSSDQRYHLRFVDRIRVKGKVQPQSVYELFDTDPPDVVARKLSLRPLLELALAAYHLRDIDRAEPLILQVCEELPSDPVARLYATRCREYRTSGRFYGTGEAGRSLPWQADFETGVKLVDDQHEELLAHLNALAEEVRLEEAGSPRPILDYLGHYAAEHFQTEEALMRAYDYPFLADHEREHRKFVDYFVELKNEITAGHDPLYLLFRVQVFLLDWFVSHSTGTDRHFSTYLLSQGAPPSVAP